MMRRVYADTHFHLDMSQFDEDREQVLERARDEGVGFLLTLGTEYESSRRAVELAHRYASFGLYAAVGVHPHDAKDAYPEISGEFLALGEDPRVLAIGETGLDYYYDHSPREIQRSMFRRHIAWAREINKPVVVHVREAYEDALAILESEPLPASGGILHCFSGNRDEAERVLNLGMYLSFGGPLTWKRNEELRELVASLPRERILCETDSPFLAPHPKRGKRNEPALVMHVYRKMGELFHISDTECRDLVWGNLTALFPSLDQHPGEPGER